MVEGDYTALTTSTRPIGQSVQRLIEMIDWRVGLSLSRGEMIRGRLLFCLNGEILSKLGDFAKHLRVFNFHDFCSRGD